MFTCQHGKRAEIRDKNQKKRKFQVTNFRKFGFTSRGCPLFKNILENVIPLATGNFGNFKPEFLVGWKASFPRGDYSGNNLSFSNGQNSRF